MKGKKIPFLILILIIQISSLPTHAAFSRYSTSTLTASGGSQYQLYFEADTLNWELGKSYLFKIGIFALKFNNDVKGFYDIMLKVKLTDTSDFEIITTSSVFGTLYSINETYSIFSTVDITESIPKQFSVFIGSVFIENESIATDDPKTDDGWTKIVDISTEIENLNPNDNISPLPYKLDSIIFGVLIIGFMRRFSKK